MKAPKGSALRIYAIGAVLLALAACEHRRHAQVMHAIASIQSRIEARDRADPGQLRKVSAAEQQTMQIFGFDNDRRRR
mgnify:CR=1 FL=1|tara:strand:- start:9946 stop:10179 length:234 start_codon:yes stop_codon:yes gene_type:complete